MLAVHSGWVYGTTMEPQNYGFIYHLYCPLDYHHCIISWVKNPKLKAILDTYHASYKLKHRYWTGLLLLVHCALSLVFAFNISGDDSSNFLVIPLATSGIFAEFTLFGKVYKS